MVASLRPTVNLLGLRTKWTKQPHLLRTLTWDNLKELAGTKKVQVINDFRRHGIMLEVRLVPEQLGKRLTPAQLDEVAAGGLAVAVPNAQSYIPAEPGDEYEDEVLTLTDQWQRVSALVGFWLRDQTFRSPLLGAAYTDEQYIRKERPDGGVEWKFDFVRVPRVALLEFRGPGDAGADQPPLATGLALPRFERRPVPVPAGASFDFPDDDELPTHSAPDPAAEADADAAALAALEPTDEEIAQAVRSKRR